MLEGVLAAVENEPVVAISCEDLDLVSEQANIHRSSVALPIVFFMQTPRKDEKRNTMLNLSERKLHDSEQIEKGSA